MTHRPINRQMYERARELGRDLREQDEARQQRGKEEAMSHKKTKYGLAKRPPDLDSVQSSLDGWQEQIDEVLATARVVAERERATDQGNAVDPRRFPLAANGGED